MANNRLYNVYSKRLEAFITAHGMRKTQERFAILRAVCDSNGHFQAEELRDTLEARAYHVSLASVYNTLEMFCHAGIVTRNSHGGVGRQYELLTSAHIHLVCSQCGKVKEVQDPELVRQISLRRFGSFTANTFSIDIFGICAACARLNRKNTNKKNPHDNGKC